MRATVFTIGLTAGIVTGRVWSNDDMTATAFILAAISPLIVALIRRREWTSQLTVLLSVVVVLICYTLGQFLDGLLTWPLTPEFWAGAVAAFGTQQLAYQFVWPERVIKPLEDVGSTAKQDDVQPVVDHHISVSSNLTREDIQQEIQKAMRDLAVRADQRARYAAPQPQPADTQRLEPVSQGKPF